MATYRGGWRTMLTGGVESPIGDRPLGSLGEDVIGDREDYPLPKRPQEVGEAKERGKTGVRLFNQTAAHRTVESTASYNAAQHCAMTHGPGNFSGSPLASEEILSWERWWKHV